MSWSNRPNSENEEAIISYVAQEGPVTLKQIANAIFDGDCRRASNVIRGPVASGTIRKVGNRQGPFILCE
jgi:hypothetical protein